MLIVLLTKMLRESALREGIYRRLWPSEMSYNGNNNPHERQISDHKRKLIAQIRKKITGKVAVEKGELKTMIFTRPKVGYILNMTKESVLILPSQ